MKKKYILDTSVLRHDPDSIDNFADNTVIVPLRSVDELDHAKTEPGSKGKSARDAIRSLEQYRAVGSLHYDHGVATKGGGKLIIDDRGNPKKLGLRSLRATNDNHHILAVAMYWKDQEEKKARREGVEKTRVILVTKDIAMRVKADALGLPVQDYESDRVIRSADELYSGFVEVDLDLGSRDLIADLHNDGVLPEKLVHECTPSSLELLPNTCCLFRSSRTTGKDGKAYAIYDAAAKLFRIVRWKARGQDGGRDGGGQRKVRPINPEQELLAALLDNPNISLVTTAGVAGTGKTLMALRAALTGLERNEYERITVLRANKEIGEKLGFMPGDLNEKFAMWQRPIVKLLVQILGKPTGSGDSRSHANGDGMYPRALTTMFDSGQIEIIPINFLRGDTFSGEFVIVDEAQNLSPRETKTVLTRAGLGTKFVLTGDIYQIDDPYLDAASNGLSHTVERMKGQPSFAHLTLVKTERSSLAETAARLL